MTINRRQFLKSAGFGVGGLCLSNPDWALPQDIAQRNGAGKRIAILGAALAGLAAGWELEQSPHDRIILEPQLLPFVSGYATRDVVSPDLYAQAPALAAPDT